MTNPGVSIVIATYGRHQVLIESLERLLALQPRALEIVVVDQSPTHPAAAAQRLEELGRSGAIRWLRRAQPSIPGAMNQGLLSAAGEVVLFVDDDVVPARDLVTRHAEAYADPSIVAVAGQVLQPGEQPAPLADGNFAFRSTLPQDVDEVIGCNFSVRRDAAVAAGGFDENFVQVAYRYEAEFCARLRAAGGRVRFAPDASLRHLRASDGGTRSYGDHLRTARPAHAVGEYYFLLSARQRRGRLRELVTRPWRALRTRHHLRRPWWIGATLLAELLGLLWASSLRLRGPRLLDPRAAAAPPGGAT